MSQIFFKPCGLIISLIPLFHIRPDHLHLHLLLLCSGSQVGKPLDPSEINIMIQVIWALLPLLLMAIFSLMLSFIQLKLRISMMCESVSSCSSLFLNSHSLFLSFIFLLFSTFVDYCLPSLPILHQVQLSMIKILMVTHLSYYHHHHHPHLLISIASLKALHPVTSLFYQPRPPKNHSSKTNIPPLTQSQLLPPQISPLPLYQISWFNFGELDYLSLHPSNLPLPLHHPMIIKEKIKILAKEIKIPLIEFNLSKELVSPA